MKDLFHPAFEISLPFGDFTSTWLATYVCRFIFINCSIFCSYTVTCSHTCIKLLKNALRDEIYPHSNAWILDTYFASIKALVDVFLQSHWFHCPKHYQLEHCFFLHWLTIICEFKKNYIFIVKCISVNR
jgi:hypothetical protein